jgi:hypothetical protein
VVDWFGHAAAAEGCYRGCFYHVYRRRRSATLSSECEEWWAWHPSQEQVKGGRFARLFGEKLVANAWLVAAAPFTVVVTQQADFAQLVTYTLVAMAGALGKAGAEAYEASRARLAEVKGNQLYFYYRAGQRLQRL